MKYIIMEVEIDKDYVIEVPIIFPDHLVHMVVARKIVDAICHSMRITEMPKPIAAGFVRPLVGVACFGESESLKLKSRGEIDSRLIECYGATQGKVGKRIVEDFDKKREG